MKKSSVFALHVGTVWLALSSVGCGLIASMVAETAKRTESIEVPLPESGKCVIKTVNGGIECLWSDVDAIEVQAVVHGRGRTIEAAQENLDLIELQTGVNDGEAFIRVAVPIGISGGASLVVTLPKSLEVEATSTNGAIRTDGIVGGMTAKTSNGKIEIKNAKGVVHANSSNGNITVDGDHLKDLQVQTSNGRVEVSGNLEPGDHSVNTSNGAIHVRLFEGASPEGATSVTATTSNGKVIVNGSKVKSGSSHQLAEGKTAATLRLTTSNGSIDVSSVPSELANSETADNADNADHSKSLAPAPDAPAPPATPSVVAE
ncbi:hypothetical protein Pla22_31910 [Rubripirellula amarantea]|uniref:DUF4097 domain-containing protein n=1 Tax=Rubripirellula amarantea TaxID=2527999 RepID=A0A5C5WI91_9BACT|nr:DUF4097 family beta strand repeat-containing protein [Rubripirellula amarantea]TWT50448.1 hypothetical protein Pla22_31910 [Rubripirellula amarantea]